MNYSELQEIIKHIKKIVPCSNCKKKFMNEDLEVISTFQNEGLFHFSCRNCRTQLLVHANIVSQNEDTKNYSIATHDADKISKNEILDMHNFLGNFNGDFENLFIKSS